jgi:DNA-directed RNA polymerase subunit L
VLLWAATAEVRFVAHAALHPCFAGANLYFDTNWPGHYTGVMEVRFTPEEQARLSKIATEQGLDPEDLVKDAALRLIEDDARFRDGVRKGLEQADRDQFIEE